MRGHSTSLRPERRCWRRGRFYSRYPMATLGITGLANTGKTSLFAALTARPGGIAPFPFSTTEARLAVTPIVDPILQELGRLEGSARITPATLEVTDGPPLQEPGGDLDARTVGKLRQADCMVVVLRAFEDPSVPHGGSGTDPRAQAEEVLLAMAISDAQMFEGSLLRLRNQATSRPERRAAYETVGRAAEISGDGDLLRERRWSDLERKALADFAPLTLKPVIWVVNVDEEQVEEGPNPVEGAVPAGDPVLTMTLRLEAEAAMLDEPDRAEMLQAFGLGRGAAAAISFAVLDTLAMCTFYTSNSRETRAWITPMGSNARQAAGKVHSDMERGFIRAEVGTARAVIEAGGWDAARARGVVRVEGRDYPVQSGDVLQVRFSV
ncbi:MAG: redox-regulated ATPase YchF [Acidimicrobiia bacterium]|nr:redox-regulated ATPase YchF [Acidimicrobiia bacterium]